MYLVTELDDVTATLGCKCSGKLLGDLLHASLANGLLTHVFFFIDIITDYQSRTLGCFEIDVSRMRLFDRACSDSGFVLEIEVQIESIPSLSDSASYPICLDHRDCG